jgi:predicted secreted protein
MRELLELYVRLLWRSFAESRWLQWLLALSFVTVVAGLLPVLWQDADPFMPTDIAVLDLAYLAALTVLFLFFAFLSLSVMGIPLLRYGGASLVLLGIGIFAYQIYGFARFHEWQPFALRDFTDVAFLTVGLDDATGTTSQILRAFLDTTPLSLCLIALGLVWHVGAKKILAHELRDLRDAESERFKPINEVPRPKLAVPAGRWIPTRVYKRGAAAPPRPLAPVSPLGKQTKLREPEARQD